jgi:hypothetical protein
MRYPYEYTVIVSFLFNTTGYIHVQVDAISKESLRIQEFVPEYLRILTHTHGMECCRIFMRFQQYITIVFQKEYERYRRKQIRMMGFTWPQAKHIHSIVGLSIDAIYVVAVFDTMPLFVESHETIDWILALTEIAEHFGTLSSDLSY